MDSPAPGRPVRGPRTTSLELTFLPGLADVLRAEVAEVLLPPRPAVPVPGRDDALAVDHTGPVREVLNLRTAVAAWIALHFDVPRPRSLTSGDHLHRIVEAVYTSLRATGSSSFRFEAAGADSAVFARLAELLHQATGLQHRPEDGELVVKVRRGRPAGEADPGWDALVRIGSRPLSARRWRVVDLPGAANATIAAAMSRLAGILPEDRVLNLMCGSGTLLIERLLAGPAAAAVGVDLDPEVLTGARTNLEAAGLSRAARLVTGDAADPQALRTAVHDERFDLLLADPPWGTLVGSHADAPAVHAGLLAAAHAVAAPGARLAVLTHEVTVMQHAVAAAAESWTPIGDPLRVYAKGHHPRIWLLRAT